MELAYQISDRVIRTVHTDDQTEINAMLSAGMMPVIDTADLHRPTPTQSLTPYGYQTGVMNGQRSLFRLYRVDDKLGASRQTLKLKR